MIWLVIVLGCITCWGIVDTLTLDHRGGRPLTKQEKYWIENGYAKVSKNGSVYLDFDDPRTQERIKELIEEFNEGKK